MEIEYKNKYSKKIEKYISKIATLDDKIFITDKNFDFIKMLQNYYKNINIKELKNIDTINFIINDNNSYPLAYINTSLNYKKWCIDVVENNINIEINKKIIDDHYNLKSNKKLKILTDIIYDSNFISIDIQYNIEKMKEIIYEKYTNDYLNLEIFYKKKHSLDINLINKIVLFLIKISEYDLHNPLNLILILTNQKKYLTPQLKKITSYNTNSGYTIADDKIVIWRSEELYKVLIHELCHYFKIDTNIRLSYIKSNIIKLFNIFNIENKNDVQMESYTELCAITINSVIFSIEYNKNINQILNNEIKFSFFQVSKILNFFNATSVSELIEKKILISQTTSVLSYYIIKLGMLLNFNKILSIWKKQNNMTIKNKSDDYIDFYFESIDLLKKYDNIFENIIENNIKNNNCGCFINKTLRMSFYELR